MNAQLYKPTITNKFKKYSGVATLLSTIAIILVLAGCASQPRPVEEEKPQIQTVWPLPPEKARFRYLGELRGLELPEEKTSLKDVLLGKEEQQKISSLAKPYAVHSDSKGRVFVADTGLSAVVVFDLNNKGSTSLWGTSGRGALSTPTGVTSDEQGNIYVSDSRNKRIVVFDNKGNFERAFGGKEILELPAGLVFSEQAQKLYVVDTKKHQVFRFDKDGNLDLTIGANGTNPGYFNSPTNIAIDSDGRLYVADSMNFRIQVLEEDGTYVRHIGQVGQRIGDFFRLKGVGLDTNDNIYAVDASFSNFQVFNQQGQLLIYIGSGGSGQPGKFALPAGMHVDKNNHIFVADQYNQRIQMFEFLGGDDDVVIE